MKNLAIRYLLVTGCCAFIIGCGGGGAAVKSRQPQVAHEPRSVQGYGLTVVVNNCQKSGSDVNCHYVVTSEGRDRSWAIYIGDGWQGRITNVYDDLGNEYKVAAAMIGNQVNKLGKWSNIVADVPTAGVITINNVNTKAITIKKIKMVTSVKLREADYNNYDLFSPDFPDIPITAP